MSFVWLVEGFWGCNWEYVNTHGFHCKYSQTDIISRQSEHQSRWSDICYFWYEWQSWGEGKFRVVGDNLVPETESEENNGRRQRKLTKKVKNIKFLYWKVENKGSAIKWREKVFCYWWSFIP